jgi:hypothetical protein
LTAERPVREVTFEGSHFERGLQRGRRLKETLVVPEASGLPEAFVAACRAEAEALHPPAAEEFEGLLQGGGFDRRAMAAYYFARLESRLGGCTMFAVQPAFRDGGRGPVVGRNYDWATEDLRWCELQRYRPSDGLRRVGYTHHWAGCADVLNERGLYLAIASLPPEPVLAPGVQWSILVDMITERCATVAEAVAVCARVSHLRPMSYLLADASGDVAVVEATPRRVSVRRARSGFVAATNVLQGGEELAGRRRPLSVVLPEPGGPRPNERSEDARARSERRLRRVEGLLSHAVAGLSEPSIRRILADHEGPICTGCHGDADGAPWATIWSGICTPAEGRFLVAPGLPCRHAYASFGLDA